MDEFEIKLEEAGERLADKNRRLFEDDEYGVGDYR